MWSKYVYLKKNKSGWLRILITEGKHGLNKKRLDTSRNRPVMPDIFLFISFHWFIDYLLIFTQPTLITLMFSHCRLYRHSG